jgi:hypothetical protein
MKQSLTVLRGCVLLALVTLLSSCLALAAGAGAGAAIAYNERGVSSKAQGTVDQVFQRSVAVFREMGITQTGQDSDDDDERELKGTRGDLEVTVDIKRENASMVSVEVFAQKNTVEWDRDYARDVLQRILSRS